MHNRLPQDPPSPQVHGWTIEAATRLVVNGEDVRSVADHDERSFRFNFTLSPLTVAEDSFSAGFDAGVAFARANASMIDTNAGASCDGTTSVTGVDSPVDRLVRCAFAAGFEAGQEAQRQHSDQ